MSQSQLVGGPIFQTPTEVATQLDQIDGEARNLDANVKQHISNPTFTANWQAWLSRWTTFFNTYRNSSWNMLTTGTGTVSRQAETFHTELGTWGVAYQKALSGGGNLPLPTSPGTTDPQRSNNMGKTAGAFGQFSTELVGKAALFGGLALIAYFAVAYYGKHEIVKAVR